MSRPDEELRRKVQRAGGGAMDLAALKALGDPEKVAAIKRKAEATNGMRCGGCNGRIESGFRFTAFTPIPGERGGVDCGVQVRAACSRDDCDFSAALRNAGAAVVEYVELIWLDELPDDDGYRPPKPKPEANGKAE